MPTGAALSWIDWMVIAAYAACLLGIGLRFSRRQRTTEEYFLAGRNQSPFLAGISSVAAKVTVISYFSHPGEFVQNGPVWGIAGLASLPIAYLVVGWIMIPIYMRLPITSVYELLEVRLGRSVRRTGSLTFIFIRLAWMAVMLYTASMVLVSVMGWDPRSIPWVEMIIGLVTTFYTLIGGIETVLVTSVLQFGVLLLGAFLTLITVTVQVGGVSAWWPHHWMPHWKPEPFFSLDPHVRVTAVGAIVGLAIFTICIASSDQVAVQRYLTTKNTATARRSYLHNTIASAATTVMLALVGAAVLGYYRLHPIGLSFAQSGDRFFPHFIAHHLPIGVAGLVISGILAAAMSGLSSSMNSVITVISKDFLDTQRATAERSEAQKIRTARFLTLATGALAVTASMGVRWVHGNLAEVAVRTINLFTCPMFGLFFLSIFVPFATPFGAIVGAIYGLAGAVVVAYWDVLTGLAGLSFQWILPISLICTLGFGCLFSLLPTRGQTPCRLAALAAAAFVPLLIVAACLLAHALRP